jgi:hypothetical protein
MDGRHDIVDGTPPGGSVEPAELGVQTIHLGLF